MTHQELHANIAAGRYADTMYIWYMDDVYTVSIEVLYPLRERIFVNTVGGYRKVHGL